MFGWQATKSKAAPVEKRENREPRPGPGPAAQFSLIGESLQIDGDVASNGDLEVAGRIDGNVQANGLVVHENGEINGDVRADDVRVAGTVTGTVLARNVSLTATAEVNGDVVHQMLSLETGAALHGRCKYSDDPSRVRIGDIDRLPESKTTSHDGKVIIKAAAAH